VATARSRCFRADSGSRVSQHAADTVAAAAIVSISMFQLPPDFSRITPPTTGATNPARLPIIFIAAATVAVYAPPISTQASHEIGIVRSLAKLASPMATMAGTTDWMCVNATNKIAVERNPQNAIARRGNLAGASPEASEPKPPNNRAARQEQRRVRVTARGPQQIRRKPRDVKTPNVGEEKILHKQQQHLPRQQ